MFHERFPLAEVLGLRVDARLAVNPGVIQLRVKQRALEAFDDLELRIELRLDRKLPQQRLAEGVDSLGAQRIDARQLLRACAALFGAYFDEGMRGVDRPCDR